MTISESVELYLKHYPRNNDQEFTSRTSESERDAVQALLNETASVPIEWGTKTLSDIGQEVKATLHERHPELTPEALRHLANYFTYLVK